MNAKKVPNTQQQMLDFLMEKIGMTEADIQKEIYKDRIVDMASKGNTIGEMVDIANDEGWLDVLYATKFADAMPSKRPVARKSSSGRLTKQEVEDLREAILSFLKSNPESKKTEIASAVGFDPAKITPQLQKLKDEGLVKTEGARVNMVYRLAK